MAKEKRFSTFSKTIQSIILLFFLVALPFGSYYYLRSGFEYRKEAMDQLEEHGEMPTFTLRTQTGKLLDSDALKGNLVIVHFMEKAALSAENLQQIAMMNDQFDNSGKVVFLSHIMDANAADSTMLEQKAMDLDIEAERGWFLLYDNAGKMTAVAKKYPKPKSSNLAKSSYAMLVDSSLMVRNFYSLEEEASVRDLVTHIAMIIPREKDREDIVFKRKKEK